MKQLIIAILCIMTTLPSFGELRFKMLETNDSTTVITLKEKNMRQKAPATASRLYNDGATYEAIEINNSYENCCNVYKVVFPRQAVLNNTRIELTIGKKTITAEIWEQMSKAALRHYPHLNGSQVLIIKPE